MTVPAKTLLTATSTVYGGRHGEAYIGRDRLHVALRPGHTSTAGTDPEELFAAGYASCFLSALNVVADSRGVSTKTAQAKAHVSLHVTPERDFFLSVLMQVHIPDVDRDMAHELVQAAHDVCPYSRAVQGNIEVVLEVLDQPV